MQGKEQCISSLGISNCVCFPACSARFDQVKFIQFHVSYRDNGSYHVLSNLFAEAHAET